MWHSWGRRGICNKIKTGKPEGKKLLGRPKLRVGRYYYN
jgi:hypothetical protein